MASKSDCCAGGDTIILACSGGSNVGQITNIVAKRLDGAGDGRFFCLAGVGARIPAMVEQVKKSRVVLVLDGCPVACAKKCMDQAGLTDYRYLVATDLGIEKRHTFDLSEADIAKTVIGARDLLGAVAKNKSCKCDK
jgi:uncharacterized metal-binding protein